MKCEHCRASFQPSVDMPVEQIVKIIRFARQFSPNYKEIIISGGEPTIHREFEKVMRQTRENGGDFVTLTTNGSLITKKHISLFRDLAFRRMVLSVSLDSLCERDHDLFRKYKGAFMKAERALSLIADSGIPDVIASVRCTIKAHQIPEMEKMVDHAASLGCKRVSFSAIHPAGRAIERSDLWMTAEQKLHFIKEVYRLKPKYPDINITTNDPLKCLLRGMNDLGGKDEIVFDGCGAGAITFNVNTDGTMTPCALLNLPMMKVFPLSIEQMTENYKHNQIVAEMLTMNLKGKCGGCKLKYQCGGCRARALIQNGDYLAEDPHCWL